MRMPETGTLDFEEHLELKKVGEVSSPGLGHRV